MLLKGKLACCMKTPLKSTPPTFVSIRRAFAKRNETYTINIFAKYWQKSHC